MTLTEFLLARIAEDEWDAQRAAPLATGPLATDSEGRLLIDPARVLAECEAKRRIVESHLSFYATPEQAPPHHWLKLLALPYADHPDYDEEWRPDDATEVVHEQRDGVCIGCEQAGQPVEWLLAEARGHSDERDG